MKILFILFIIFITFLSACSDPIISEEYLLGVSLGNGSANVSLNLAGSLLNGDYYYPIDGSSLNYSLLNTNFTAFITQEVSQYNISAYGQSNTTPCFIVTNNGTENITVRVKINESNSNVSESFAVGNDNITGSPKITLNTSFQDFFNLTVALTDVTNESLGNITVGTLVSLDNDQLKPGTFILYNSTGGEIISTGNYTLDTSAGTVNLTSAEYNNTGVEANYTYGTGQSINVSCFGDYINFNINNSVSRSLIWNITVI